MRLCFLISGYHGGEIILSKAFLNVFSCRFSSLQRIGIIKRDEIYNAMNAVDRADFCSTDPYCDSPQYIGHGATISAPHMHATILELLYPSAMVICIASRSI